MANDATAPVIGIEELIYLIRGQKVMLDKDLAALYGVDTRALVQAVKRNEKDFQVTSAFPYQIKSLQP